MDLKTSWACEADSSGSAQLLTTFPANKLMLDPVRSSVIAPAEKAWFGVPGKGVA
jgi:hypothetical protein